LFARFTLAAIVAFSVNTLEARRPLAKNIDTLFIIIAPPFKLPSFNRLPDEPGFSLFLSFSFDFVRDRFLLVAYEENTIKYIIGWMNQKKNV
jgi:hypothetical protein